MKDIKYTFLEYTKGTSDKVYNVYLRKRLDEKYQVDFGYGRRGNKLIEGSKTEFGVSDFNNALDIYDKLLSSKIVKGYNIIESYIESSESEHKPTKPKRKKTVTKPKLGVYPQLLNEITESNAYGLIYDDEWMMQIKHDGRRRILKRTNGKIEYGNRKGEIVKLNKKFYEDFEDTYLNFTVDGEDMGDKIILFDVISKDLPADLRKQLLYSISLILPLGRFEITFTAYSTEDKLALMEQAINAKEEGVVFKKKSSLYTEGRPASGGDMLKYKFTQTCSCFVEAVNSGKRSIRLGLYDVDEKLNFVGNATVYSDMDIPKPGEVVEVKYLYATNSASPKLFQPVLLKVRDDIDKSECLLSQLKYKKDE